MRKTVITTSLAALLLISAPAYAQTSVADPVITQIEAEGYVVTDVRRSWLGRIVITASNDAGLREVVLNRVSGEILHDQRFPNEGVASTGPEVPPNGPPPPQGHGQQGPSGGPEGGGGPGHGGGGG